MSDWSALLDEFETRLGRCRRLLDAPTADGRAAADRDADVDFALGPWPPAGTAPGPMPAELVDRARRCLDDADGLAAELEAHRRGLPPVRSGSRNRRGTGFSTVSTHL